MKRHRRRRANRAYKGKCKTKKYPYLTVEDVCRMFGIPVQYMYTCKINAKNDTNI